MIPVSNHRIKRLRIFIGPNGSGKSTLYDYLVKIHAFNTYFHINPDSIAKDLPVSFNMNNWPITVTIHELKDFLDASSFQSLVSLQLSTLITMHDTVLSLKDTACSDISYLAAALADFIRYKMLNSDSSFSFETVFSHPSKIQELEKAKQAGYKIYVYVIATSDPLINLQRVQNRVESGGHDVPEVKITERYYRTMEQLYEAFCLADRAFFFDNSQYQTNGSFAMFAEKRENTLYIPNVQVPQWFNTYVLQKLEPI